jgi:hypothetical protein
LLNIFCLKNIETNRKPRIASLWEKLLFDRSQIKNQNGQHNPNARQAAEALFAPKQVTSQRSFRETPASSDDQVRRPRVLPISRTSPEPSQARDEGQVNLKRQTASKIPKSHFARIRVWRRYGMTDQQVAEMYGVAVDEIERILR